MTDLVLERLFDAPHQVVYDAFVDPDQLARWFGPIGFACPRSTIEVDPRPGGPYKMTMVNQDDPNQVSPINAVFDEVEPGRLLVGHEDITGELATLFGTDRMNLRIEFEDRGEQTLVRVVQGPYDEKWEPMARAGWNASFTKLDNVFLVRLGMIPAEYADAHLAS